MVKNKLSVIMAVYNGEDTVSRTIDSILNQTFKDFEFVIVDDASTDSTSQILKKYMEKDSRVKVLTNEINLGRCVSRNLALEFSSGEYVAVTDADDISKPNRFAKEVVYLDQHPECYLVAARADIVDEKGKKFAESFGVGCDANVSELLEKENRLVHSSVMFRNTKDFWYREKFRYAQDYDLFLQILLEEEEIHLLEDILVEYTEDREFKFNEYVLKQRYYAEIAKYLFKEARDNMVDRYDQIDTDNLEKYVDEKIVFEMEMKKAFFEKDFKLARSYAKKLIDVDPDFEWRLYFLDTFFQGNLRKIFRTIKRSTRVSKKRA